MPRNLTVTMPDRIGAAAELCEALAQVGININGMAAFIRGGQQWGVVNILVEDPELARKVIEEANLEIVDDREVLVIELEDAPGSLARALREIARANASVELLYMASKSRLVVGTEAMQRARSGVKTIDVRYP